MNRSPEPAGLPLDSPTKPDHDPVPARRGRLSAIIDRYTVLTLTVFLTFWLRFVLSDRHSYWLDELYSMESYLLLHDSVGSAIRYLMDVSVHPPTYHVVLYYWVEIFGSTETATRTLSNLYVTIAIVVLHRLVHRFHGMSVANAAAITFAFSYGVTYYGNETRSYAQTLLLVVLSSYALFKFIPRLATEQGVRRLLPGWPALLFLVTNSTLLLTHYYNLFYWAAQAAFAAWLLVSLSERSQRFAALPALASAYLFQIAIFLVVAGRSAYSVLRGSLPEYRVEVPEHTPLDMAGTLVAQNLEFGPVGGAVGFLIILGLVAWRIAERRSHPTDAASRHDLVGSAYSMWMAIGPVVAAYVVFLAVRSERFTPRFYIFLVPHLAVLAVLGGSQLLTRVIAWIRRIPLVDARSHLRRYAIAYTLALVALMVVPGTLTAATQPKEDWRGVGRDIIAIMESNPGESFAVYEPSMRWEPMLDHYLRRFSGGEITVTGVIRTEEEAAREFQFERDRDLIEAHDRLIVPFVHHTTEQFPVALGRLERSYGTPFAILDEDGRGLLMFDLAGDGG